jgi:hypothetical protein
VAEKLALDEDEEGDDVNVVIDANGLGRLPESWYFCRKLSIWLREGRCLGGLVLEKPDTDGRLWDC